MTEFGELLLLILFGIILFPDGSMLHKALWTLVFCGIGMGATLGAFINILVVDRFHGMKAIFTTTALSLIILGIACNLLCLNLDKHFHYFGGSSNPYLFSFGSVFGSVIGGLIAGTILFTEKGNKYLERLGI
ncbi:MAG: hypothetical protein ACYS3N_23570 [Planctomycetota bacterium]|jgi:hypothetical protein